jgi:carbonic anhydrase
LATLIEAIRRRQALRAKSAVSSGSPAEHRPEMLYFGCVDARLDPIADIGIQKGKAIIFRNIAALVIKNAPAGNSVGAVLEFFLNHLPFVDGNAKQIVVSAHTDCGGLKACLNARWDSERDHYLPSYLEHLRDLRERVEEQARVKNWNPAQVLAALERESVRQSITNLQTYPVVRKAIDSRKVELHGWVLDTHSGTIFEMDPETGEFRPMAPY